MNTSGRLKTPEPILGPAPRIAARGPQTGQQTCPQTGQPADALTVALTAAVLAVRGAGPRIGSGVFRRPEVFITSLWRL